MSVEVITTDTQKKKASAAHMRATAKYEAANYDRANIRFPKGTRERIRAHGYTVNGFAVKMVLDGLKKLDGQTDDDTTT